MFKNVIKEQLKVPAHIDYLGELRDFVVRVGKKYGISDKIINAFKLAIDEAGTNIIRHAYRDHDGPGFILLRVIVRKASITVSLIDEGKYFDPKNVKDPDLKRYVDIGKKGGLGIFIIRKLMDEIDYRRTEEGNELRLTKYRTPEGKKGDGALPQKVKQIPLSLKAKYFIRTAIAVTVLIAGVYVYFFIREAQEIRKKHLTQLQQLAEPVLAELLDDPKNFELENLHHLFAEVLDLYKKYQNDVFEFLLIDRQGMVEVTSDTAKITQESEEIISNKVQVQENIYQYTIERVNPDGQIHQYEVFDLTLPIVLQPDAEPWGELHIRVLKQRIDQEILDKRWEYARLALSILLMSYAGALLLIYILLNPFRKLADWVRAMDHGEVQDEMDIDSSTEIGEIAKAFSEITTKFRESQRHLAEQEQLQKEMQVAQEIQQTLLPTEFPEIEGYEIASYYEAAKEVGGDYFDFVEVDKDTIGIVVADVSGKGVPGSLVMTMIRTALRTEARGVKDAAEVLARVNDFVVADMKKGMFVTIFYVIIDSKRRRLNYASAGHNPMILYRPSTRKTYYLNPKGFPIGIQLTEKELFRKSIESDTIQLAEDDILLLYTDGITEAMNSRRQLFGEERLLKVIREYGHLRVKPFIEKVKLELYSFTEGQPQYDDITLVAIKEKTSPEKEELRRAKIAHQLIAEGKSIREACETAGITTYAYYNKYKRQFEQAGVENYEIDEVISVEAKHISIEDKTKIFDIIKNHPEYGAKRISEELNTEKYGFTIIPENKIYDELVRSRLNTRQLREAFVARGGRNRRHMKPPGTPLLTLDGRIIMDQHVVEDTGPKPYAPPAPQPEETPAEEKTVSPAEQEDKIRTEQEVSPAAEMDMEALSTPIEELLDKSKEEQSSDTQADSELSETKETLPGEEALLLEDKDEALSFEKLFSDGAILEEATASGEPYTPLTSDESKQDQTEPADDEVHYSSAAANVRQTEVKEETAEPVEEEEQEPAVREGMVADEDLTFGALEDLLKKEIFASFEEISSSVVVDETEETSSKDEAEPAKPIEEGIDFVQEEGSQEADAFLTPEPVLDGNGVINMPHHDDGDLNSHDDTDVFLEIFTEPENRNEEMEEEEVIEEEDESRMDTADQVEAMERTEEEPATAKAEPAAAKEEQEIPKTPEPEFGTTSQKELEQASKEQTQTKEQLLVLGLRFYKSREFDRAIRMFQKTIELYPDFKEAYSILGNAYFRKGLFEQAFRAYLKVLEIDPTDTTALENIGVIYANQGELDKAIRQWEKILKIDPGRNDIQKKIQKAFHLLEEREIS